MLEPTKVIEESDSAVSIVWSDETEYRYDAVDLRRACPCAGCINEWTGEKMLNEASIPDDIKFNSIAVVGRYALSFNFSDGHDTGIFSYKYLRQLSEQSG